MDSPQDWPKPSPYRTGPHKQTKSKPSHPWVDCETKKLIPRKNKIHKRGKKCGDEDLKQEFKLLKRQVQKNLRRLYSRLVENLISYDVTNPTSSKKKCTGASSKQEELTGWVSLHSQILGNSLHTLKNKPSFSITSFVLCSVPEILLQLRSSNYVAPYNQTFLSVQIAKTSTLLKKG